MNIKLALLVVALCCYCCEIDAQEDTVKTDGGNRLKRYWNSLVHGNVDRTFEKRFDVSYIVAPCYTREGSFGIGGMATGLYRLDRRDSIMQPSDISISGSTTIKGFYTITVNGNNHFKGNKSRLSYRLQFQNKNLDFWGVTFDDCDVNPVAGYKRQMASMESDYVYKFTKALYVGAALNLNYTRASNLTAPDYLNGQKNSYFFTGLGISLTYDTRDFILNPKRGIYFMLREVFYPKFMSNHSATVFSTTVTFDTYQRVWRSAVLAFDVYGHFNNGDTPWTLREELGSGTRRMRGYYSGRYIDDNLIAVQMELRQHIYSRIGCVAWVGGGTVFPSFDKLKMQDVLPNYGIGLRIEFKHNANMRIDYGFGKGQAGIVCQFAEAF